MEDQGGRESRIYFGSLEKQAQRLTEQREASRTDESEGVAVLPFSAETEASHERYTQLLEQLEQQKKAKAIPVSTNDEVVKMRLRELGEPIILFGEQPPERRERLREILVRRGVEVETGSSAPKPQAQPKKKQKEVDELFYTEGTPELKKARRWIASYSLQRANERLEQARKIREQVNWEEELKKTAALRDTLRRFNNNSSQIGDDRPLACCTFSPDASLLATSSWSGLCKLWNLPSCDLNANLRGHGERTEAIVFHPASCLGQDKSALNLASGSADMTVKLWSLSSPSPLASLVGHTQRISDVAFHPSGRFIASASHDKTWRLYDAETRKSILVQEGHSRGLAGISFHPDGSLAISVGLDAFGRVWDTRTGKSVMVLRGHALQILAVDCHPNGYQVATGSDDHTVKIWDLRQKKCSYTIPAHSDLISSVKFQPGIGEFLVTASFDKSCRIWSTRDWSPIATLSGHEGKVMDVDISHDSQFIVSASYDRTWKMFLKADDWP